MNGKGDSTSAASWRGGAEERLHSFFRSSGDILADRRYRFAGDLAARGELAAAADLYAQALEIAPDFASAWFALGEALGRLGDRVGAVSAFERALAADPADRHGAALHLARLRGVAMDLPADYVRAVFDQYAPRFDAALAALKYRGPALLLAAVGAVCEGERRPLRFATALDLGCGTGLAGAAFRPFVVRLTGIDLAPAMVEAARSRGVYDDLLATDLSAYLANAGRDAVDLMIAADVFVYLRDLALVVADAARSLAPGGLLAFTVETHDGDGVILGEKLRYAHALGHVETAVGAAGLTVAHLASESARDEAGSPAPGLVVVAKNRRPR